jgi:UDP-N-acetylglucosamine 2-epimerase (non-hydrolysing)
LSECRRGDIFTVVGTRPEIIKVAPVVRACIDNQVTNKIVHTGQHYSYELDSLIFEDLSLPIPEYNLKIGSGSHAEETARALVGLESFFREHSPRLVLVQGDTNSALAGALAASKLHIPVGHIEAGLRSFDREMPEEKNRVLIDHISDILFAPTRMSAENLAREGISESRTFVTGNTIVDAVNLGLHILEVKSKNGMIQRTENDDGFLLMTLHREENVDSEPRLRRILSGVSLASSKLGKDIVFPVHPRTVKRIKQYDIPVPDRVHLTQPNGYLDFLRLERDADLILTDSGGVQEEACILGVPCVTLRGSTERPETIKVGANYLSGNDPREIVSATEFMTNVPRHWPNPFGDGKAGARILDTIVQNGWTSVQ